MSRPGVTVAVAHRGPDATFGGLPSTGLLGVEGVTPGQWSDAMRGSAAPERVLFAAVLETALADIRAAQQPRTGVAPRDERVRAQGQDAIDWLHDLTEAPRLSAALVCEVLSLDLDAIRAAVPWRTVVLPPPSPDAHPEPLVATHVVVPPGFRARLLAAYHRLGTWEATARALGTTEAIVSGLRFGRADRLVARALVDAMARIEREVEARA